MDKTTAAKQAQRTPGPLFGGVPVEIEVDHMMSRSYIVSGGLKVRLAQVLVSDAGDKIVAACNAHDDLVGALNNISQRGRDLSGKECEDIARAALAKV